MTMLLTMVMTPPENVRVKKSSLTLGYASRFLSLPSTPSIVPTGKAVLLSRHAH